VACFQTHLTVAMGVSGICATSLLVAGLASPAESSLYFALGTVGGVAPDVDSDSSTPLKIAFEVLSFVVASLVMFGLGTQFSALFLCIVWISAFFAFRHGVFQYFTHSTVHRGVFHTIPAAVLLGFITAAIAYRITGMAPLQAWLTGIFIAIGYLVHLILDEAYSVNLYGMQMKKSFGTAFKFFAPRSPIESIAVYVAIFLFVWVVPDTHVLRDTFANSRVWKCMGVRFFPHTTETSNHLIRCDQEPECKSPDGCPVIKKIKGKT